MRLPPFLFSLPHPIIRIRILSLSLPTLFSTMSTSTKSPSPPSSTPTPSLPPSTFPTTPYSPLSPSAPFPYHPTDFHRADESPDPDFYSTPRFVTHIDDHAIALLKKYYAEALPRRGRVLDLCSSWASA